MKIRINDLLIQLLCLGCLICGGFVQAQDILKASRMTGDGLPRVFMPERGDWIDRKLRYEAALAFQSHQLPYEPVQWERYRKHLREEIIQKAGVKTFPGLPLNYKETGSHLQKGYSVKNIVFQTRPGVYATANLYIPEQKPDLKQKFPAVIATHGHWERGKMSTMPLGQTLALNGYVCLTVDAWGSGERTTVHGKDEYHGANLGASLLNIGETLMGVQISDNIRAVDLLCSLPYVDVQRIGATGASGGGNQCMWLSALDERIKAAMPVVSVGTFESYVMRHNCVCELLPDGLKLAEESAVLAMVAPRALQVCNARKDTNPTFFASEMLRSYRNALPVFEGMSSGEKLNYRLFDTSHGYWPEIREAMLGWFDLHLKGIGDGAPKKEIPFDPIPESELMVFPTGKRDAEVESLPAYCVRRAIELKQQLKETEAVNVEKKRSELRAIVRLDSKPAFPKVDYYPAVGNWERMVLSGRNGNLIPVLLRKPRIASGDYVIVCHPGGKEAIPMAQINDIEKEGKGIVVVDLWGTGEAASAVADGFDKTLVSFHTLSRASLWLGKTVLGEWISELDEVIRFIHSRSPKAKISIDAAKEAGLAGLFLAALGAEIDCVVLRESPVSYQFDERDKVDAYSMAVHLPGIIEWGDIPMAAAMSGRNIIFIDPRTLSGNKPTASALQALKKEFEQKRKNSRQSGQTIFE